MKTAYLEHVNYTVRDLDETIRFIKTAIPEYQERGGGIHNGRKWVHIGTADTYLAINEAMLQRTGDRTYNHSGVNHFGFVVNDVESVSERLLQAGYQRSFPKQVQKFRIRDYFDDAEGNQYEFVQYLSEDPEEKNSYND